MMIRRRHRHTFISVLSVEFYFLFFILILTYLKVVAEDNMDVDIPYFDPRPNNVSFHVGETATLLCSVKDLHSRFVVWRRMSEPNPLTIGDLVYSPDDRISIKVQMDKNEWNLVIKDVNTEDAGVYECAVSSREKYKRLVLLRVTGEGKSKEDSETDMETFKSRIVMSGKDFVSKGSSIFLMCNASSEDYAPDAVDWFINGHLVNPRTMPRVRIYDEVDSSKRTLHSILSIRRSEMTDRGIYVCRAPNSKTAMITVHILDEEKSAIDKRGSTNNSTHSCQQTTKHSFCLLTLTATCLVFILSDL